MVHAATAQRFQEVEKRDHIATQTTTTTSKLVYFTIIVLMGSVVYAQLRKIRVLAREALQYALNWIFFSFL